MQPAHLHPLTYPNFNRRISRGFLTFSPSVSFCIFNFVRSTTTANNGEDMFMLELPNKPNGLLVPVSVKVDNSPSSAHTVVQILCHDHKGLIYDTMRTLKDYNIQVSYDRFTVNKKGNCEIELFTMQQTENKKIVDPSKQAALCSRLRMELAQPLRIHVISCGPDTELLVSSPVEFSGRGRPLVFHDITLALKDLGIRIFSLKFGGLLFTTENGKFTEYYSMKVVATLVRVTRLKTV